MPPAPPPEPPSAYPVDELPPDAVGEVGEMATCEVCSRSFAADRLERHMKICSKQATKKRKVFGESAERLKFQEKAKSEEEAKKEEEKKAAKKALWQKQHEQFQNAMKTASAIKKGEVPPPEIEVEDSRTPCPHCGRKFNADVAERHIPKCTLKGKPGDMAAKGNADKGADKSANKKAPVGKKDGGRNASPAPTDSDKGERESRPTGAASTPSSSKPTTPTKPSQPSQQPSPSKMNKGTGKAVKRPAAATTGKRATATPPRVR